MAIKQIKHHELEGFSADKQIHTTSWPIGEDKRVSVCTGWNGKRWMSTVRIKTVSTGEFGPVVHEIPLSFRVSGKDAHVIAVNETKGIEENADC